MRFIVFLCLLAACSSVELRPGTIYTESDCVALKGRYRTAHSVGQGLSFAAGSSGIGAIGAARNPDEQRAIAAAGLLTGCLAVGSMTLAKDYHDDIERYCRRYNPPKTYPPAPILRARGVPNESRAGIH